MIKRIISLITLIAIIGTVVTPAFAAESSTSVQPNVTTKKVVSNINQKDINNFVEKVKPYVEFKDGKAILTTHDAKK